MSKREHRRLTAEQKLEILKEADQPGVTVSEVCRRHALAVSVFYRWRAVAQGGSAVALKRNAQRTPRKDDPEARHKAEIAWNSYFAQRKRKGMLARLRKPSLPMQLWQVQQGHCPVCTEIVEEDHRWAIQPVIPLQVGDNRSADHLRMLHSSCLRSFRFAQRTTPSGDNRVPAP